MNEIVDTAFNFNHSKRIARLDAKAETPRQGDEVEPASRRKPEARNRSGPCSKLAKFSQDTISKARLFFSKLRSLLVDHSFKPAPERTIEFETFLKITSCIEFVTNK